MGNSAPALGRYINPTLVRGGAALAAGVAAWLLERVSHPIRSHVSHILQTLTASSEAAAITLERGLSLNRAMEPNAMQSHRVNSASNSSKRAEAR